MWHGMRRQTKPTAVPGNGLRTMPGPYSEPDLVRGVEPVDV